MNEQEAIRKWQEGYWQEEVIDPRDAADNPRRITRLTEIMYRPAVDFKGPDDPDLWGAILYLRQQLMKMQMLGERAKRSEFADENIDLSTPVVKRPEAYRRF
jgi:hypothetical protein